MIESPKKRILVIDDEQSVRIYLETFLQDNGYDTALACDGREAMEKTRAEKPDLVLLDIMMPEKSGVRYYRELKGDVELGKIPIIIVTAVTGYGGHPEEFEKFISTRKQVPPPEGFIAKPIDREKLLGTVQNILG